MKRLNGYVSKLNDMLKTYPAKVMKAYAENAAEGLAQAEKFVWREFHSITRIAEVDPHREVSTFWNFKVRIAGEGKKLDETLRKQWYPKYMKLAKKIIDRGLKIAKRGGKGPNGSPNQADVDKFHKDVKAQWLKIIAKVKAFVVKKWNASMKKLTSMAKNMVTNKKRRLPSTKPKF